MAARDLHHETVKTSLIKDGWIITDDPLVLKIGTRNALVDLGAEKLIAAERNSIKIAVEVKTFISPSPISDLEKAWGQFFLYSRILRKQYSTRQLYLAVDIRIFETLFEEEVGQLLLAEPGFKVLVFDAISEEIFKWQPPINI